MKKSIALAVVAVWGFGVGIAGAAAVSFSTATATFSQTGVDGEFPVLDAISGAADANHGWAIHPNEGRAQTAIFQVGGAPVGSPDGTDLRFSLTQIYVNPGHTIGKFRLSATESPNPTAGGIVLWFPLAVTAFSTASGQLPVSVAADGTVLMPASSPGTDIYFVDATYPSGGITGFRLEVLPDASLPLGGPGRFATNGNFVLSQFAVDASPAVVPESSMLALGLPAVAVMLRRRR